MGGRDLPVECEHGGYLDVGAFGDVIEPCEICEREASEQFDDAARRLRAIKRALDMAARDLHERDLTRDEMAALIDTLRRML